MLNHALRNHPNAPPAMAHTYDYPRPALTVDLVVFATDPQRDHGLQVMLIRRGLAPFKEKWALPGGFVHVGEDPADAARRELREETGLTDVYLEQLATYGAPKRDPREHVVTVAHFALVNPEGRHVEASTDADDAAWFDVDDLPKLAFDHDHILTDARERLKGKLRYQPIGFELLPKHFPLRKLQALYETVLDRELDKRNFRKKLLAMDLLIETNEVEKDVQHRAAKLYRFDKKKYDRLSRKGFHFDL